MFKIIKHPLVSAGKWQEIALGSSNQVFKATIDNQSFMLRINASCEFAFGVDRAREAKVLALIEKQSWTPLIIEYNLEEDWCLMLDHGSCLQVNEQSQQQMLAWLAQLLASYRQQLQLMLKALYLESLILNAFSEFSIY